MASSGVMDCPTSADAAFGPRVAPCRRQFDFTLLFEDCLFSIAPSIIFFLLAIFRLKVLNKKRRRVRTGYLHRLKIVRSSPITHGPLITVVIWRCLHPLAYLLMLIEISDGYLFICLHLTQPSNKFLFRQLDSHRIHGCCSYPITDRCLDDMSTIALRRQ